MNDNPWEVLRRIADPDLPALDPDAVTWVLHLPSEVRPHALAKKHPRLVNRLARLWSTQTRSQLADVIGEYLTAGHAFRRALAYDALGDLRGLAYYLHTQTSA